MKRILSWVLAMVLLLSCMPAGAVQAESLTQTVQPQPVQEVAAPEETPAFTAATAVAAEPESLDNRQLLEGYAYSLFYGQIATFGRKAGDRLTGDEKLIYDTLVPIIQQIAAGERTSTVIGLGQTVSYGGTQYVADVPVTFTGAAADSNALQRILSALLTDLPYHLYWYDKVTGAKSFALSNQDGVVVHFQLILAVADNYQGSGEYTVDSAEARAAVAAAEKSAAILAKYASASDYEKLLGYKEEICSLVTYDRTAADAGNFSLDDDPWQLIHVFDGNTATNVVCEGYSKAFMYLCQQTDFAGDVSCITVTGIMGGAHMWNIVTLEGENYLVDVTNSEPGTVGADGSLFLAGGTGSVLSGYTVGDEFYSYMDKAEGTDPDIALWGSDASSILTLAAKNYTPKTIVASGTCGDNLTWTLDDAGTLTISGIGPMTNYVDDPAPWESHREAIKSLMIADGVTSIGDSAFWGCRNLTAISVPDSITTIDNSAFYRCTELTTISIPDSVTTIGNAAFSSCTGLTSVTIPNSVTTIGRSAFSDCTGLTSVTIPNSVTTIYGAFSGCTNLTYVTFGNSVTTIGDCAFEGCISLTSVTIPDSVTTIGDYAFADCTDLASITIPDSVTTIGEGAFYGCSNLTYNEHKNILYLGNAENPYHALIEPVNKDITQCNIHEKTKLIADYAFFRCTGLNSITIPDSVTTIGNAAFSRCTGLTSVAIADSVTTIGDYAFFDCTGLTSITIPNSVTTIGYCAFADCTGLTSVTIPNSVTAIGGSAFDGCTGLTSITIPNSVITIGDWAFAGCISLTSVTIPDSVTAIGDYAFEGCYNLIYNEYENVLYLGNAENPYHALIRPLNKDCTQYSIHENTKLIAGAAFAHCTDLTSVTIPDSVITIGDWAFGECTGLTTITIPDSVTTIGDCAFSECTGLTSITIPNSVTIVGHSAFWDCTGLKDVYYGGTESQWKQVHIGEENECLTKATIHYHEHTYTKKVVKPTATAEGYTLYTCACGDSYKDDYVLLAPTVAIKLDATSGKPVLTWNTIGSGSSYYVYRSASKTGTYTKVATVKKATTWTDTSAAVGTKYYYKLKAVASGCSSGYSNLVAQTAKCAVPSITVTVKSGRPYISWGKVSGAEKYAVYYSTSKTGTYKKLVTTKKTYYAHSDAPTGSQYYYKVKCVAATTTYDSGYSSIKSCNIPCAKLAVTATNDAATGYPVLTWKAVTGAQKYEVYRSLAGKNAYEKIATTTAKTYTDKKATVNKKYDYQVRALGSTSALNSAMSTKDTVICKVAAPVISVKINGSGKPVVSWKAVKGAKSYVVYRSTSATKSYKKYTGGKLDVKKCTFTDTAVTAGKTYYYKVVAVGTGNESAYSGYKKATGTCATPSVTVKLSSNKPVLKWGKVSGAKKYEIQYSTNGKTFKTLTTTTSTSYTHKAKKGTYYYKVKALGAKSSYNSALSSATAAVKVK